MLKNIYRKVKKVYPKLQIYYPSYYQTYNDLKKFEVLSEDEKLQKVILKIKKLVKYACENFHEYREIYSKNDCSHNDIVDLENFKIFPTTDKEFIRKLIFNNEASLCKYKYISTAGSTGNNFEFYEKTSAFWRDKAFVNYYWNKFREPGDQCCVMRGQFIGNDKILINYNYIHSQWEFSTYHFNDKFKDKFTSFLQCNKIEHIHAYPSAIEYFINSFPDIDYEFVKSILLSSEVCDQNLYEKITQKFPHAKVINLYGQSEKVLFATNHNNSPRVKFNLNYGFPEFYPTKTINQNGIIGTSFVQKLIPFIKYKIDDLCRVNIETCEYEILGRQHEFLYHTNDSKIYVSSINMHDKVFKGVTDYQFVQNKSGFILFKYVLNSQGDNQINLENVKRALQEKLGHTSVIKFKRVESIERFRLNKKRIVIHGEFE